jgi:hypothetical protein
MFLKHFLESLNIHNLEVSRDSNFIENFKGTTNMSVAPYTKPLAIGLITTCLLNPKIKINLITRELTRTSWSQASLYLNSSVNSTAALQTVFGYDLKDWVFSKLTKTPQAYRLNSEDSYNICILQCNSGLKNIKTFLKKWSIPELQNNISSSHKTITFKLDNTLYVLTEIPESDSEKHALLGKITGWLPVLLKECFQEAMNEAALYRFFKDCYDGKEPDLTNLKKINQIAQIGNSLKQSKMRTALEKIKQEYSRNIQTQEDELKAQITTIEKQHAQLLQQLHTTQACRASDKWFDNEDLILQFLINNPNIVELKVNQHNLCMKAYGPVDYDKAKIEARLKRFDANFISVMANADLQLYWESCCTLNLKHFNVENNPTYYDPYRHLSNTHWARYNCFGDNKVNIQKALKNNDLLSALMQTATAAQCLNIYDITVINKLYETLAYSTDNLKPFLNTKTSKYITYHEAVKIIENKEEA